MYDPVKALIAIDTNMVMIFTAMTIVMACVFIYWGQAIRLGLRDKVYVIPFIGISVFFWHDISFVFEYNKWFHIYDHWWLKMWWYVLAASVAFELYFLYQIIKYGRKDWFSKLSQPTYALLVILATLGVGGIWFLVKSVIQDELYFITFIITAVWSVPFHTGIMAKRQSRLGQSTIMELSTIPMILCQTYAFSHVSDFFTSPVYITFVTVMVLWALANVWLIYQLPETNSSNQMSRHDINLPPDKK